MSAEKICDTISLTKEEFCHGLLSPDVDPFLVTARFWRASSHGEPSREKPSRPQQLLPRSIHRRNAARPPGFCAHRQLLIAVGLCPVRPSLRPEPRRSSWLRQVPPAELRHHVSSSFA